MYSSTFTWGGGPPPEKGDFVVIKEGQTLLIDVDTPVLKLILVQGTNQYIYILYHRKDCGKSIRGCPKQ